MAKFRSPVLGFNHNVRHAGWVFHVQTEDSGVSSPHIFTHLFHGGVILTTKKMVYDAEADVDIVKGLMQAQHKSVLKELKGGVFDPKIKQYLGEAPPGGEPMPGEQAVPAAAALATTQPMAPADEPLGFMPGMDLEPGPTADVSAAFAAIASPMPVPPATAPVAAPLGVPVLAAPVQTPPTSTTWVSKRPGVQERPFAKSGSMPLPTIPDPPPPPQKPRTVPPLAAQGPPPVAAPTAESGPAATQKGTGVAGTAQPRQAPPARPTPPTAPPGTAPAARPPADGVIVARPAVIIGAPPQVVGAGVPRQSAAPGTQPPGPRRTGPNTPREATPASGTQESSIFGKDLISEKSLDEVIMAYLSEDTPEE